MGESAGNAWEQIRSRRGFGDESISGWKQVYIDKNAARSGYWWRLNCPFGNDSLSGRCRSSHCIDVTAQEMNRRLLKWKANLADRQD